MVEPVCIPRRNGQPWSIADLLALSDEENHYELVRGDLLMMSPAGPVQGLFASRIDYALRHFVETHEMGHDLGEVYTAEPGFVLQTEPDIVIRVPDVAFVHKERIPPPEAQEGFWHLAPDLAVEIISPSGSAVGIQAKVQDYLDAGVRLIWLVYPKNQTVIEYQPPASVRYIRLIRGDEVLTGGEVLPGFAYPLARLFK